MPREYYVYPNGTPIAVAGNNEYATQIPMSANDATDVYTAINAKVSPSDLATVATSGSYTDLSNKPTIPASPVQANWNTTDTSSLSFIQNKPTSMTPSSHTHGNIQNAGTLQSSDITIANGDKLVVTDSSDSNKVARTSVSFDGSTTNQCLTKKGTWASFTNNAGTVTQVKVGSTAYNPTSGIVSLPATLTGNERIQRFELTQNQVGLVRLQQNYGACILLGFVQGIGGVAILIIVSNNSISVLKDLSTGNAFSNSYLKITLSASGGARDINVQPTAAGTSVFTAIKSNG